MKLVEKYISNQNMINGNETKSRNRFEPINGIMNPLHIRLVNDPIDSIAMTHDSSSLDNGPLANGVSAEANIGKN